jgi:hypothetical protein
MTARLPIAKENIVHKKIKKLILGRETLRSMDQFSAVRGGRTFMTDCEPTEVGTRCFETTGSYDTCAYTFACSQYCATGGACTYWATCANC